MQDLITETNNNELLRIEYISIKDKQISNELFYSPYVQKMPTKEKIFNIVSNLDYKNYFVLEPVMSIRNSNKGFEMYIDTDLSNKPVTWITPGIKVKSTIPLLSNFSNVWIYSWANFYKHSAYGFNNNKTYIIEDAPLFNYSPDYSVEYYEPTKKPDNGLDFDQSQAGISLLTSNFQLIFGKFNTNIGPFYKSNLSISNNAPSFEQFMLKANYNKKIFFSYLIGSLSSNIPKIFNPSNYEDGSSDTNIEFDISLLYTNQWDIADNDFYGTSTGIYELFKNNQYLISGVPQYDRYVVNHRIDFVPIENLRIGLYEQIFFGAKNPPLSYLIPINPLWSSQHAGKDQDNLQMGLDWEYIISYYRIYGALLMDEWALFDTFDDDERNWFAYQLGFTRIIDFSNISALLKIEYSRIDPRAYNHRFMINTPTHHGYNLGYWSGSDSDDIYTNLTFLLNDKSSISLEYHYTRLGNQPVLEVLEKQYNNQNVKFLGEDYFHRKTIALSYTTSLIYNINLDVKLIHFNTDLYTEMTDQFNDMIITLRYNINK